MKKGIIFICVLSINLFLHYGRAVPFVLEPEPVDSLVHLKGVVVTANKIKINRNNVPVSISVIEREEIETSSESALLPVLSHRIPGMFVTEKGITGFGVSSGSAGTVNVRGVGQGNKVLTLFDGQPQWAGVFGHALPDTYVASDVERVEVIRGPGSLLYGSNAMGGVINIITRQQDRSGRKTQARVMFGSYNTQKYMVNNGYNAGRFGSYISFNHDRTDGHRPNSDFRITNGFTNLGYRFTGNYNIKGNVSLAKYKTQNPGPVFSPVIDNTMDILRGSSSVSFENHFEKTSGAVQAFYNWGDHEVNDGYQPEVSPRTYLFRSTDYNRGILLYQSFRLLEGNSFTIGLDYKNWGGHAWNDSINGVKSEIVDKSVNEVAGYAVMQQDLFDVLSLNAGVRYEHNSTYGNEWVPQAGFSLRLLEGNTIKGSLSKGFRSPNLRELYISYSPYSNANPDLKPERMMNYEVSVGQTFLDNRLRAELTGYYIDGENMIQPVKGQLTNVGKFHNKGFEMELAYYPCHNLSFVTNYSYLKTNKAIVAAPKHKVFVETMYRLNRFTMTVNMQYINGLYRNTSADEAQKENYALLNARLAYKFGNETQSFSLFFKGENLTATRYSINDGYPMPKAIVMGGIEFSF